MRKACDREQNSNVKRGKIANCVKEENYYCISRQSILCLLHLLCAVMHCILYEYLQMKNHTAQVQSNFGVKFCLWSNH